MQAAAERGGAAVHHVPRNLLETVQHTMRADIRLPAGPEHVRHPQVWTFAHLMPPMPWGRDDAPDVSERSRQPQETACRTTYPEDS